MTACSFDTARIGTVRPSQMRCWHYDAHRFGEPFAVAAFFTFSRDTHIRHTFKGKERFRRIDEHAQKYRPNIDSITKDT